MVTKEYVKSIFTALANGDAPTFFNNVADNVSWTVTGTDNPLSGHYTSKSEFVPKTFQRLGKLMANGMKLEVVQVMTDGDWAAVELKANATAKNGIDFANEYCWVCRFEGDKIVQVRAYLDSALVKRVIDENE
jgi:ketosteroid isomerase-like protein